MVEKQLKNVRGREATLYEIRYGAKVTTDHPNITSIKDNHETQISSHLFDFIPVELFVTTVHT